MEKLYAELARLAARHGAKRLVLFGSRARGDARPNSDIDLAVYDMPENKRAAFADAVEGLPTLLEADITHVTPQMAPAFLRNIESEGIVLLDRFTQKYENLTAACARLREALDDYAACAQGRDTVRDGVIQRFEFTFELAWKTMREYLIDQGYTELNSPKAVLRRALQFGLISDEANWLNALQDRNLTSHVYDDATAAEIFTRIQNTYLPLFTAVIEKMQA